MVAVSETKSLAVTHPEIAAQWNHIRNGNLKPEDVTADSKRKVWWIFPYTNPYTGKHFDFEWEATVASRIKDPGCPYLSSETV